MVDLGYGLSKSTMRLVEWFGRRNSDACVPLAPPCDVPWMREMEGLASTLASEYRAVLKELDPANSPDINDLSVGVTGSWSLIPLVDRSGTYPWLVGCCAATMRALAAVPGLRAADYAILAPNSRIAPHVGHNWGVLRGHLALSVPEGSEPCELRFPRVGSVISWDEGRGFAFDDTQLHEAVNLRDKERVVLLIEFDRELPKPLAVLNRVSQYIYRWHPVQRGVRRRVMQRTTSQNEVIVDFLSRAYEVLIARSTCLRILSLSGHPR